MADQLQQGLTDAVLKAAGCGDLDAQLLLVSSCVDAPNYYDTSDPNAVPYVEMLAVAETIARIAAANGDPTAKGYLGSVLVIASDHRRKEQPGRAERDWQEGANILFERAQLGDAGCALLLITKLTARADDGDEEAAAKLNQVIAALPPEVATAASVEADEIAKANAVA